VTQSDAGYTPAPPADFVLPFDLPELGLRGRIARLDAVSTRALAAHPLPEAAQRVLAESLLLSALLGSAPDVSELIEVDTFRWRKRLYSPATWSEIAASVREIRKRDYDVVLDLQGTSKSSVAARLARTGRRVGFATRALKEKAAGLLYSERVGDMGSTA